MSGVGIQGLDLQARAAGVFLFDEPLLSAFDAAGELRPSRAMGWLPWAVAAAFAVQIGRAHV